MQVPGRSVVLLLVMVGLGCEPSETTADGGRARDAGAGAGNDAGTEDAGAVLPGTDAGPPPDAGPVELPSVVTVRPLSPESVPAGKVPIGLAIGNGRIATTCDRGHSYAQDWIIAADANDHHEYAAVGGGAFGQGVFVVAMGWGAPGHVLRSTDGIHWDDLEGSHFHWADGSTGRGTGAVPVVFYDGARFGIIWDRYLLFSDDGVDWTAEGDELEYELFHLRQHSFPIELGVFFLRGQEADGTHWMMRSEDDGLTRTPLTPAEGFDYDCGGRARFMHGALLTNGGDAAYCVSFDAGETWTTRTPPAAFDTILPTSTGFLAFTGWDNTAQRSTDAVTWEEAPFDNRARFAAGGYSPHGYYVAASHFSPELFRSDDGETWTALSGDNSDTVEDIRSFTFGYGDPTTECPLP